uniref:Uncharacterized protein n=1 Tax=Anguilla anguilla TaxID=7936 RepID=A0A0E9PD86_ANGAN
MPISASRYLLDIFFLLCAHADHSSN